MKLKPLHDKVLVRIAEPKSTSGLTLITNSKDASEGVVVTLGEICGKSEAQGLEPGCRCLFDRTKAKATGLDTPDLLLVGEDDIHGFWEDEPETN